MALTTRYEIFYVPALNMIKKTITTATTSRLNLVTSFASLKSIQELLAAVITLAGLLCMNIINKN